MAVHPGTRAKLADRVYLTRFDPVHAERVVSWVRDRQEAYWLAPKTPPPLGVETIHGWAHPGHHRYLLWDHDMADPVGYGELNRLRSGTGRYWLGHLIVDAQRRGCGYGVWLTRGLLTEAFDRRGAVQVTLVVFPENRAAIRCYEVAGMVRDGWETHEFPVYGRVERLLRMAARRSQNI